MNKQKKKKRKIKYKNIFIFIFIAILLFICIYFVLDSKITNIYIKGNSFLTDQQIIDEAGLKNYPKISAVNTKKISKKLKENIYIENVNITHHHFFREITIEITENKPILYYAYDEVSLLADGREVKQSYTLPTLINQTPEDILKKLLKKLDELDGDILTRISEIRYAPTNVDEQLFYLTMDDGNDVYINFNSFSKLNNYIDIVRSFNNKKGTVHLDSGDYLEINK